MNNLKLLSRICLVTLNLSYIMSQASVVVLAKVPQGLHALIQELQQTAQGHIAEYNAKHGESVIFAQGKHAPHLSLSYLSFESLAMHELENNHALMIAALADLAQKSPAIDMSDALIGAELVRWPAGKFPKEHQGVSYENYSVVVVKLAVPQELSRLVENMDTALKNFPVAAPREYPFSAHVTIGWLLARPEVNLETVFGAIKAKLATTIEETKDLKGDFIIKEYFLSSHDQKQKSFALAAQ